MQCIKSGTPHEQCTTRRSVPSSDDDVKRLAGITHWSQKNGMPHNVVKPSLPLTKRNVCIYKRNGG
jgi:hypothetical protein